MSTPDQRIGRHVSRGVRPRYGPEWEAIDRQIADLAARGLRDSAISRELNISRGKIKYRRRRKGIQRQWAHGEAGYSKHGCRCDVCSAANSECGRRMRAELQSRPREVVPHGSTGYKTYGCRCDVCTAAGAEWNRSAEHRRANRESMAKAYARTAPQAVKHGQEWTGPELETAARLELSAEAAAILLGRTIYAVRWMRDRLRDDPRKARLAGLDTAVADKARP